MADGSGARAAAGADLHPHAHPVACSIVAIHMMLQAKQGFGLVEGHASVEDLVEEADGFAEVFPEHKFMIVKILQVGGRVVLHSPVLLACGGRGAPC